MNLVKTISCKHFCNFDFKKIIVKSIPPNNFSTNVTLLFQNSKVMKRVPRDFTHLSQRVIFFDFILFLFVLLIILGISISFLALLLIQLYSSNCLFSALFTSLYRMRPMIAKIKNKQMFTSVTDLTSKRRSIYFFVLFKSCFVNRT